MPWRKTVSKLVRRYSQSDMEKELLHNPKLEFTWVEQREVEILEDKMVALEKVARWMNTHSHVVSDAIHAKGAAAMSEWVEVHDTINEILHGRVSGRRKKNGRAQSKPVVGGTPAPTNGNPGEAERPGVPAAGRSVGDPGSPGRGDGPAGGDIGGEVAARAYHKKWHSRGSFEACRLKHLPR